MIFSSFSFVITNFHFLGSPWAFPSTAAAAAASGLGAAAAAGASAPGLAAAAAAGAVSSGTLPIPGAAEYPARLSPSQYQLQVFIEKSPFSKLQRFV